MATTDVKVPDIGDYSDVPVIEVLVKDGRQRRERFDLMVLESDKATLEVPSPAAGVVRIGLQAARPMTRSRKVI